MKQHIRIDKTNPSKGVLDYSWLLDAPAGKHGFVTTKDGHFYFEDGTRAKFLGFNVAARSNTPDHATAEKLADRFASMGVNVIRLHAADAPIGEEPQSWSSCKEAPLLDYEKGNGRTFHTEGLDRFDYFAAKLKERGIYLHIDLIVARDFTEGDGLDYSGNAGSCVKRFPMYNKRMIELQKEYARGLLCHKNPYTGLALIDDPAVITVQINNEDSAIKGTMETDFREDMQPYRDEVQKRFNHFLLMKYETRERLKEAWTFEGKCALTEEEDPAEGTVKGVAGNFYQPECDPESDWVGAVSPARYADFMEFGIAMNRNFYQDMKDYLRSLGVKVPLVTSNLIAGAADVYGHMDGDLMENNSYFNHPLLPIQQRNTYLVAGPEEYVSTNPLTMQTGIGSMATTLLSLASVAIVKGKPFMLSEWNEYGEHPFHSTTFVHTIAYACLNDWDGLILYNFHTSEKADDQPDDEIWSVFDAYNDPAVICQWGFMASVFLKGLVSKAKNRVDVVYTQNDLKVLPKMHAMPTTFLPYITSMRNVFLDGGDTYQGDAAAAINAGFLNGADLSEAEHGVYYAWSPYRDAWRKYREENRLVRAAEHTEEIQQGVHLGEQALVFDQITELAGNGDYREFAVLLDQAFKKWKLLDPDCGLVDGKLISDTGELIFDPEHAAFEVHTPYCGYFSGAPKESIVLSENIQIHSENERISISILPVKEKALNEAEEYVLTAMGNTGMDQTTYQEGVSFMGFSFTSVHFAGKLYAEPLEGKLLVKAKEAVLTALDPTGNEIETFAGKKTAEGIEFLLNGEIPAVQYQLKIEK
ncbi:hypothetical protein [Fusicatenibacter sp.]